jgi:uncharacterized protein
MTPLGRLEGVLAGLESAAVAVSGGIDSLTLAVAAQRVLGGRVSMHHAVSAAVPGEATQRTRALAEAQGWALDVFDAGEFADPSYRANPVDRCFFCKTNLYGAMARRVGRKLLSGTNTDDLSDYRPGLLAAERHGVRHPFVEAGIDKATIRAMARELGLGALSELPAAPCLSSRIQTGIRIEPAALAMVHRVELLARASVAARTVRCRVLADGIVVELDAASLDALDAAAAARLVAAAGGVAREAGFSAPVRLAAYRMGSAFLRKGV